MALDDGIENCDTTLTEEGTDCHPILLPEYVLEDRNLYRDGKGLKLET
jgi:hypothetical protein